jgi:hypothetical protein
MHDKQPSLAGHPYGRFQRVYTQAELNQLRREYPFEQRLLDLNGSGMNAERGNEEKSTTDEWFPVCVMCGKQIKRGPDGEVEWFILPGGAAICAAKHCMDTIRRKPA